jgi:tetratricopeptide (TPR) repeat protein
MKCMMLRAIALLAAIFVAAPAAALDAVPTGPAPAWVKPQAITAPPLVSEPGAPFRIVLHDRQLYFSSEGDSEFIAQATQIRDVQGLGALGTVALAWNPDTDTVIVHRLRILREGASIDVLAKQSFTVLRREANLERAIVDGVLTATLQPEGLRVGDVVDVAYTITHRDPVLGGRSERSVQLPPIKADRLSLRASWDAERPLQWRVGAGLDKPKISRAGGRTELSIDMRDPPTLTYPKAVPLRYMPVREVSVSAFKSWTEVSALMAPHFARASVLGSDSPLKAELAKIRAASSDPKAQAAAALRLVEDQVRYLALVLNLGGYVPADADRTWSLRYGDCKAKTALLIALLHELGIEAEPALVNSARGDGLDARLPSLGAFDHVIVRAVIAGKIYWLDATRTGDRSLDALRAPPFRWALPLRSGGAELTAINQPPLSEPDTFLRLTIDASAGLDVPAPAHGEIGLSPGLTMMLAYAAAGMPGFDRDKLMRQAWSAFPWIEVKTTKQVEDPNGSARLVMDGTAKLPFERSAAGRVLRIAGADLGNTRGLEREAGSALPDAPYLVAGHPGFESFSLSITLPRGGEGFIFEAPDVDVTTAGRTFTRKARIEKGVATIETSERTLTAEISATDAAAAKTRLETLSESHVRLRAPPSYRPTDKDLAALRAQRPADANGYIARGELLMNAGMNAEAMADFNKAVELDPKSSTARSTRALGHVYGDRIDAAKADIAQAQALDPRDVVALHALGLIAMRESRFADAAAAFGRAADIRPRNTFALAAQAGAYQAEGETDKALAVVAELERVAPEAVVASGLRYEIYVAAGQRERALSEIDQAIAKTPNDPRLHRYRGGLLAQLGRRAEADKAFARAIEIRPSAEAHLNRAALRAPGDVAGRLSDIAAAEALEPASPFIAGRRGLTLGEAGRYDEAILGLDAALKTHPGDRDLLFARADVLVRAGRSAQAVRDFAAVRKEAIGSAILLNGLCWQQAIRNFALETALADCQAALKVSPGLGAIVDSHAFVLMRLGRLQEAAAQYDEAIRLRPRQAESLFGRALIRLRLGRMSEGQADLAAARSADPLIDETFADYGLSAPTAPN